MNAYLVALFTVVVWGLTFVSSKILLVDFSPIELLFVRFLIALVALCVIRPHVLKLQKRADEVLFALAGLMGVVLYFILENGCLVYTTASVASIVVSTAPLFTALVGMAFGNERHLGARFFVGFAIAMAGIVLVCLNSGGDGGAVLSFDGPALLGDLMAVGAAVTWAVYSNILVRIQQRGYDKIAITKRTFAWGIVLSVPVLLASGARLGLERFASPVNLGNLLFLGLVASAACYVTWGVAVSKLGAAKTAAFIYLQPVITVVASVIVLGEAFTWQIALGVALTIVGLVLSESKGKAQRATERQA